MNPYARRKKITASTGQLPLNDETVICCDRNPLEEDGISKAPTPL
jgi:hypothetical protein